MFADTQGENPLRKMAKLPNVVIKDEGRTSEHTIDVGMVELPKMRSRNPKLDDIGKQKTAEDLRGGTINFYKENIMYNS